jgi:hypothetical protein
MSNIFKSTEAWDVSTERILGEGNHVVEIKDARVGTSSGGHPQIELQLGNSEGEIRDWLVITQASIGKVVALAQSADMALPDDDEIEGDGLRLKQVYVDRFVGRQVGIVVRDEPSYKDPDKTVSKVQGYVEPARLKGSDVPDANGNAFRHPAPKPDDAPVPF